jgi:hypothetical protein
MMAVVSIAMINLSAFKLDFVMLAIKIPTQYIQLPILDMELQHFLVVMDVHQTLSLNVTISWEHLYHLLKDLMEWLVFQFHLPHHLHILHNMLMNNSWILLFHSTRLQVQDNQN